MRRLGREATVSAKGRWCVGVLLQELLCCDGFMEYSVKLELALEVNSG